MVWHITFEDRSGRRTLERHRTWEAGADALYRLCDAWERNNRSTIGNPRIVDWASRQRGYLASAIPAATREAPRPWLVLTDRERGVTVRLERRVPSWRVPSRATPDRGYVI